MLFPFRFIIDISPDCEWARNAVICLFHIASVLFFARMPVSGFVYRVKKNHELVITISYLWCLHNPSRMLQDVVILWSIFQTVVPWCVLYVGLWIHFALPLLTVGVQILARYWLGSSSRMTRPIWYVIEEAGWTACSLCKWRRSDSSFADKRDHFDPIFFSRCATLNQFVPGEFSIWMLDASHTYCFWPFPSVSVV